MIVKIPTEYDAAGAPARYRVIADTYHELAHVAPDLPESEIYATWRKLPFRVATAAAVSEWETNAAIHTANTAMVACLARRAERHPMFAPPPDVLNPVEIPPEPEPEPADDVLPIPPHV